MEKEKAILEASEKYVVFRRETEKESKKVIFFYSKQFA